MYQIVSRKVTTNEVIERGAASFGDYELATTVVADLANMLEYLGFIISPPRKDREDAIGYDGFLIWTAGSLPGDEAIVAVGVERVD